MTADDHMYMMRLNVSEGKTHFQYNMNMIAPQDLRPMALIGRNTV